MREEFKRNLHRIFFGHQHDCRFIVLYTNIAAVMLTENDLHKNFRSNIRHFHINHNAPC